MVFYIYEIRNNLNGKNYVGQRKCPENKTRISLKLKMIKVKESYQKYKLKNNKITWNEFQKLYKNGEV